MSFFVIFSHPKSQIQSRNQLKLTLWSFHSNVLPTILPHADWLTVCWLIRSITISIMVVTFPFFGVGNVFRRNDKLLNNQLVVDSHSVLLKQVKERKKRHKVIDSKRLPLWMEQFDEWMNKVDIVWIRVKFGEMLMKLNDI